MAKSSGLKRRARASGTVVYYWIAAAVSPRAKDYPIKTRTLKVADEAAALAECEVLTAELQLWLSGRHQEPAQFAGTIASLIDSYQRDEDSPYQKVKDNTRHHYNETLRILLTLCGESPIGLLSRKDFARWYATARAPAAEGGPERIRRAHNCMKVLRIIFHYGKSMRYLGCKDAVEVLEEMRFELPAPRHMRLMLHQAEAIIDAAIAAGRPSLALAQALQFELSLRQKDVIGEWTSAPRETAGIVYYGQRWSNGVLWSDLSPDLVLTKKTTKTAAVGQWNLSLSPLVTKVLAAFPADKRVGPMIVSETTGHPYRPDDFRVKWREIARAAGVPDDVWNMDSRAGGISEGDEAGADINDLRKHATHTDAKMTGRYIRSGTLKATENVAQLRVAHRGRETK